MRTCLSILVLIAFSLSLASCATPYVHKTPGHSDPLLNGAYAVMDDSFRLPLNSWEPQGRSHAVVLAIHGMNDYSNSFASTGSYLSERGITVVAYDQRGFGATEGHGLWHGSERLVQDVHILTALLRDRYPDQPLYLLGESMGGAVVLSSLHPRPPDIDGIILVAPAVWSRASMPYYQRALLWLAAHTVPARQLTGEGLDLKPSDNVEMLRALGRDPLVIKKTRVDVLFGVANLMDNAELASSADLSEAMLILYGKHDEIIPKKPTCRWLDNLPANPERDMHTVIYENGYHMLTRDLQADRVLHDIADWLRATEKRSALESDSPNRLPVSSFCSS